MTPERMAELLASELIEDIDRLAEQLLSLEDRWTKYGQQYQQLLSPEKRAELEAALTRFHKKLKHLED